jgi:hypothetical protein
MLLQTPTTLQTTPSSTPELPCVEPTQDMATLDTGSTLDQQISLFEMNQQKWKNRRRRQKRAYTLQWLRSSSSSSSSSDGESNNSETEEEYTTKTNDGWALEELRQELEKERARKVRLEWYLQEVLKEKDSICGLPKKELVVTSQSEHSPVTKKRMLPESTSSTIPLLKRKKETKYTTNNVDTFCFSTLTMTNEDIFLLQSQQEDNVKLGLGETELEPSDNNSTETTTYPSLSLPPALSYLTSALPERNIHFEQPQQELLVPEGHCHIPEGHCHIPTIIDDVSALNKWDPFELIDEVATTAVPSPDNFDINSFADISGIDTWLC